MRVLCVHSYYQQLGGEDLSFDAECALLERHGHTVIRFTTENQELQRISLMAAGGRTLWNRGIAHRLLEVIRRERPDVMHCTNLFPLMSPACLWAAAREGVPIVQALRNYRLLCPGGNLFRDGVVCERCVGKPFAADAIRFGCYRGSRAASAIVAASNLLHRAVGSWRRVHVFYTLTAFARSRFVSAGFHPDRICVKPNFLDPDPGVGSGADGGALFVGRLSPEKGIDTLLAAWRALPDRIPLRIVGDGPLAEEVARAAAIDARITWLGAQPQARALESIGRAGCLVMPSNCYETFGRTIMEAFACGTPVIASNQGAMAELVEHGRTGLLYPPGDAAALAQAVATLTAEPDRVSTLREAARASYVQKYTGQTNHKLLMEIYDRAIRTAAEDARSYGQHPARLPSGVP